ncbi:hypothetical protein HRR83_001124 [Exophiala dermatitidis]|uniref:Uncharacterized protein n=2 Tax=Exophiala dermatitidis TaxID=5970 RepID=H6C7A8_EXODN|nr:uncharacterized protein HMPREF1120_07589 [Exophiala dermatitidis NIH/UT8656]KAJ4522634.1 hypothetical protein HRR75_001028 [Exophiala dermatitidis]EHY59604.1 hypothetical protein HMPREF1120_07589 [Exophiala dermatitidis NIH/UT8656]KAJ4525935.1 hypothetical protein HRR74_001128 [Exophiala dermatitidis]KAJ4527118.1 hypothetical protein HRR73_001915 [Exophiala dermatitidis]KAJ4532836.1 hypothetical protein HRR76_007816 [Exophiala dermatitidis]
MCGDSHLPPAPESGDLIAIIHPYTRQSTFQARLRLSNRFPGATTSTLTVQDANSVGNSIGRDPLLNVRIHKFGQPLSGFYSSSDSEAESDAAVASSNPIMHSFFINPVATSTTGDLRLNLGVGGDGIVGRTVSICDRRNRRILGEGVIGWC